MGVFETLVKELAKRNATIATMESCTSGMFASLLTDVEGSSAVFHGGLITYSNDTKSKFGVDSDVIEQFGVYSPETAKAMAIAAREQMKSDIGIGVTGTFENVNNVVEGNVFFNIAFSNVYFGYTYRFCNHNRHNAKQEAAVQIAKCLVNHL